jgi:hypothetical protein
MGHEEDCASAGAMTLENEYRRRDAIMTAYFMANGVTEFNGAPQSNRELNAVEPSEKFRLEDLPPL